MSKIALQGDVSGTGTFTIKAPNSNSNYDLTLPSSTGTVVIADATGGLTVPSLNGGQLSGMRNKIINGKMEIAQRGASGSVPNSYTIDRWILFYAGTAPTWTRVTGGSLLNEYFSNLLEIAGVAGNTGINVNQRIEAINSADLCGKTVTFSAYVLHTNTGGPRNFTIITQRPNTADNWGSGVTQMGISGNISVPLNVWTRITWTTTLPASGPNFGLSFEIITGSVVATQGIYITGAQLEVGEVATPFEHRPYGTELMMCQRYYQTNIIHTVASSMPHALWHTLQVATRVAPTITATLAGGGGTGYATYDATSYGFRYLTDGAGPGVADFLITASAEL